MSILFVMIRAIRVRFLIVIRVRFLICLIRCFIERHICVHYTDTPPSWWASL